jgi:hypothetical protein
MGLLFQILDFRLKIYKQRRTTEALWAEENEGKVESQHVANEFAELSKVAMVKACQRSDNSAKNS